MVRRLTGSMSIMERSGFDPRAPCLSTIVYADRLAQTSLIWNKFIFLKLWWTLSTTHQCENAYAKSWQVLEWIETTNSSYGVPYMNAYCSVRLGLLIKVRDNVPVWPVEIFSGQSQDSRVMLGKKITRRKLGITLSVTGSAPFSWLVQWPNRKPKGPGLFLYLKPFCLLLWPSNQQHSNKLCRFWNPTAISRSSLVKPHCQFNTVSVKSGSC